MIIIINKAVGIFGALITQGTAKASWQPYMPTGRLVLQKVLVGRGEGKRLPLIQTILLTHLKAGFKKRGLTTLVIVTT